MIALFLVLVALFAWAEHIHDGTLMRLGVTIDRKAHAKRWRFRATVVCVSAIVPPIIAGTPSIVTWVLMCIASGALFSSTFRYLLNKRRGKHPCYVSPSSWYDGLLMWAVYVFQWLRRFGGVCSAESVREMFSKHADNYHGDTNTEGYVETRIGTTTHLVHKEWYRTWVHSSGATGYAFEILTCLAALVWVAVKN